MWIAIYPALRRALFTLDPERAHGLALSALNCAHSLGLVRSELNSESGVSLMGIRFPNRVGLAAGFDKSGRYVDALGSLGFGFIEVGTVTPKAQSGQPRPRLFRLAAAHALINRMGFPNDGAAKVAARLATRTYRGICGVNIGKNAGTPLEVAFADYAECFRIAAPVADYIAVNVSSPNTKQLRRLQQAAQLRPVLDALSVEQQRFQDAHGRRVPVLLKIAPDLTGEDLSAISHAVREREMLGVIATNTTMSRTGVNGVRFSKEEGGLSGRPLREASLEVIRGLRSSLPSSIPIVAVGGIDSAEAAQRAFEAGADLVQIYTGLIYRGPGLVQELVSAAGRFDGGAVARDERRSD